MVDCVDRITLQLTEWFLRPLQALRDDDGPSTVTLRPPGRADALPIRVTKSWPNGPDRPPRFDWSAAGPTGAPPELAPVAAVTFDDPEDAYWAAIDALAALRR